MEVVMKKMLKKILFISLLLSATVPSAAQENFSNKATLKKRVVEVGSRTVNWLTTNSKGAFNFLKKNPVAVGGTIAGIVLASKLSPKDLLYTTVATGAGISFAF